MVQKNIESFLKLGYFLDYQNPDYSFDFSQVNKSEYKNKTIEELTIMGKEIFIAAIENLFKKNSKNVVPISGGLDSRAILSVLMEFTDVSNIYTYTFGTPGTLDYEIGNRIARDLGTKHIKLPLTDYEYNMEELIDVSKRINHQTVLFHHPPVWKIDELFSDGVIWSGFFGGQLAGDDYLTDSPTDLNSAQAFFIRNEYYQKSVNLNTMNDHDFYDHLNIRCDNAEQISKIELLNFYNRQLKFIAPHVLMKGYNYSIPFIDQKLINFFLSIDDKLRINRLLFKKIFLKYFPTLFTYPAKNNFGLPINASKPLILGKRVYHKITKLFKSKDPFVNYLDFDIKIREQSNLNNIIKENIFDLYNRKIIDWVDVREIYKDHINNKGDFGKALLLLCSLEIHLKAKELNKV